MQLEVTGQNIDVTQAMRAYLQEKTERLERHYDNLISGHFVMRLDKLEHTAEGTVHVGGKTNALHAVATAEDMYAAIDGLIDKLDRQVRRYKSRITDHRNSP